MRDPKYRQVAPKDWPPVVRFDRSDPDRFKREKVAQYRFEYRVCRAYGTWYLDAIGGLLRWWARLIFGVDIASEENQP